MSDRKDSTLAVDIMVGLTVIIVLAAILGIAGSASW